MFIDSSENVCENYAGIPLSESYNRNHNTSIRVEGDSL
jgi:hypothetical protein